MKTQISATDWSFDAIAARDPQRARQLEAAGTDDELVRALAHALDQAWRDGHYRLAVDSLENAFVELRAIVQFQVTPELYDWFFNARTGYRSRFWIAPEVGQTFNGKLVGALSDVLSDHLPKEFDARRIEVEVSNAARGENDTGAITIGRNAFLDSMNPGPAKIWICERRYTGQSGSAEEIGFAVLTHAAELIVPRWQAATAGLRAPRPDKDYAWLDLKGGFVDAEGTLMQPKTPLKRAQQLHNEGWT
jgi:hypothetical protein